MKQICLFSPFFLLISIAASAQRRNDNAFHAMKMSKDSIKTVPIRLLSQNYYAKYLGFFCKAEIQVEKSIKLPVKFRLGSVQYCDAMEGKSKTFSGITLSEEKFTQP